MKFLITVLVLFYGIPHLNAQTLFVTTIAGTMNQPGYSGDGGMALNAKLYQPFGLAVDKNGNLYIADNVNAAIRKIDNAGIITTIAGTGTAGYSGDGGPAISAKIGTPWAVTVDNTGNIYIADGNATVRKINTAGIITTIAGNGTEGYSGDGGPATSAQLNGPIGLAVDMSGNVYISDARNSVIRKVDPSGIISTFAGSHVMGYSGDGGPATSAQIAYPLGIALDKFNNLYIPDEMHSVIRKVNTSGIISTFAGNGTAGYSGDGSPATSAEFGGASPYTLSFDNDNNAYLTDYQNYVVRKIDNTGIVTTIAGSTAGYSGDGGPALSAQLWFPRGLAIDNNTGIIYISDTYNNTIRKIYPCTLSSISLQPASTSVCSGQSATFSLNATNTTGYQWQMNSGSGWNDINNGSIYQGATSNSLTIVSSDITLNNNLYRCKINGTCNSIFSSAAALTVTLSQIPEVSLTASSNAAVCANTPINFTATPGGGGTAPSYQWQLNGVNVGTDNPSYTDAAPVDGDMVKCIMTSNAICATASTASSNSIAISILPPVTPAVSITASSVNICANTPVTFNASADNGGLTPSYQWELNSVATATGGSTYTTTALNDGDVISCVMTGSAGCMISPTAASNDIVMKVNRPAPAAITISASSPSACEDEDLSFTATATNGGNTPLYQWKVNDKDEGINENIFISHSLTNGDQVSCVLTSSTTCVSPVHSNNLSAVINPLPVVSAGPDTALFIGNSVQLYAHVTGAIFNYDWTPADGLSATSIANPIAAPDDSITYYLTVTTNDGCKGYGKVKIALLRHLLMPNAFTPNNDGKNDVFRIPYGSALELEDFSIYDRWGSLVFKTTDIGKGWDGYSKGIPAGAGGYAYFIRGIFQKKEVTVKGMVLLVR